MTVSSPRFPGIFLLRRSGAICLAARTGTPPNPIFESACPESTGTKQIQIRQLLQFSYWTLLNASGTLKLMNAHLDPVNGCLLVPSGSGGAVGLGSCSLPEAGRWKFVAETGSIAEAPAGGGPNVGMMIVGIVVGVVVVSAILGAGVFVYRRRRTTSINRAKFVWSASKESTWGKPESPVSVAAPPANLVAANPSIATAANSLPPTPPTAVPATNPQPLPATPAMLQIYMSNGGLSGAPWVPVRRTHRAVRPFEARQGDELDVRAGGESFPGPK